MADKTDKPQLTGAFDLFGKSAELVQKNLNMFILLFLLPFVMTLISSVRSTRSSQWSISSGSISGLPTYAFGGILGAAFIFTILLIVASVFIQAMTYILELKAAAGQTPDFKDLFDTAKKYWLRLFGLGIIVGVLTVLGLILFIVPGLIVIRRYYLAAFVLIDKDVAITEAMMQSAEMSKPYSGWVWSVIGVTILLSLPGAIPVIGGVISLVLAMFYSVAPALRYQELKKLYKPPTKAKAAVTQ